MYNKYYLPHLLPEGTYFAIIICPYLNLTGNIYCGIIKILPKASSPDLRGRMSEYYVRKVVNCMKNVEKMCADCAIV